MTKTSQSPVWLRCATAALTAYSIFWGTISAFFTVTIYSWLIRAYFGPAEVTFPESETSDDGAAFVLWVVLVISSVLALLTMRWQWSRMRRTAAGDHVRLALVLVVVALAVTPHDLIIAPA